MCGDLPIQASSELGGDEGSTCGHKLQPRLKLTLHCRRLPAEEGPNSLGLQPFHTATGYCGVRITDSHVHGRYAAGDDRVGTRRRASHMVARFKGDIERRTVGTGARFSESDNLGVVFSRRLGKALTHDLAVLNDDGPDRRVGTRGAESLTREGDGPSHVVHGPSPSNSRP